MPRFKSFFNTSREADPDSFPTLMEMVAATVPVPRRSVPPTCRAEPPVRMRAPVMAANPTLSAGSSQLPVSYRGIHGDRAAVRDPPSKYTTMPFSNTTRSGSDGLKSTVGKRICRGSFATGRQQSPGGTCMSIKTRAHATAARSPVSSSACVSRFYSRACFQS